MPSPHWGGHFVEYGEIDAMRTVRTADTRVALAVAVPRHAARTITARHVNVAMTSRRHLRDVTTTTTGAHNSPVVVALMFSMFTEDPGQLQYAILT